MPVGTWDIKSHAHGRLLCPLAEGGLSIHQPLFLCLRIPAAPAHGVDLRVDPVGQLLEVGQAPEVYVGDWDRPGDFLIGLGLLGQPTAQVIVSWADRDRISIF